MKADAGTALEELVVATWSEILQVEVDPYVSFVNLGGTAVDAVLFGVRLSGKLGIKVPLSIIFGNPTVAAFTPALAALVAKAHEPAWAAESAFVQTAGREPAYPALPGLAPARQTRPPRPPEGPRDQRRLALGGRVPRLLEPALRPPAPA